MLAQNESNNFSMKIDGLPRKGEQKAPKRKDCAIVKKRRGSRDLAK